MTSPFSLTPMLPRSFSQAEALDPLMRQIVQRGYISTDPDAWDFVDTWSNLHTSDTREINRRIHTQQKHPYKWEGTR